MYTITLIQVAGAFGVVFLLISVLQRFRSRREQARSKEAAAHAAAAKRFEEIFRISPHASREEVVAKIKTVVAGLGLLLVREPSHYEAHHALRVEVIRLAERFGFHVLTAREMRERQRNARRRIATTTRQTGGAANSAA